MYMCMCMGVGVGTAATDPTLAMHQTRGARAAMTARVVLAGMPGKHVTMTGVRVFVRVFVCAFLFRVFILAAVAVFNNNGSVFGIGGTDNQGRAGERA